MTLNGNVESQKTFLTDILTFVFDTLPKVLQAENMVSGLLRASELGIPRAGQFQSDNGMKEAKRYIESQGHHWGSIEGISYDKQPPP